MASGLIYALLYVKRQLILCICVYILLIKYKYYIKIKTKTQTDKTLKTNICILNTC